MAPGNKYEAVIGLEVHVQLSTKSKLFCGDSAAFGALPNTNVSPISLAHPGTLPKMNRKAINHALALGISLNCDIVRENYFARKNYFYPDLPKGYQVSQHTTPICRNGSLNIRTSLGARDILLNRIHIEEDAGKSLHDADDLYTSIDLNRAGVALLEIVTEPVMHTAEEASVFVTDLRRLVRYLDICDGNMEQGSLRCDANISIRKAGTIELGTKVEIKNLNSIRNVRKAIEVEILRLTEIVDSGGQVKQETRSYDAEINTTSSLRSKEDADDYRYFPEPDLPPFHISNEMILSVKKDIPPLPSELQWKYVNEYHLSETDAALICEDKDISNYFEKIITNYKHYKAAVNWVNGPIRAYLNTENLEISNFPIAPSSIAQLIKMVEDGQFSFSIAASRIFPELIKEPSKSPESIAISMDLLQERNEQAMISWVEEVIVRMPEKVKEYKKGKRGLIALFAAEVKKSSKGKADMKMVTDLLVKKLNN